MCLPSQPSKFGLYLSRSMLDAQIIKNEPLEITFSYWDGSGHRRKVVVKKGDSINDFLKACRDTARFSVASHACRTRSIQRVRHCIHTRLRCIMRQNLESLGSVLDVHVC